MNRHMIDKVFQYSKIIIIDSGFNWIQHILRGSRSFGRLCRYRAILRYSFCRGRDILNIHPFITLSILMVETSYCTYTEAVTCVFQCVINFFYKLFQLADIFITNSVSDGTSNFTNFQVTLLHAIFPLF